MAAAPGLLPGVEHYVDNGPHLVEVAALAGQVLPHQHSWVGWADGANLGMAVGQLNAPLAWTPLAALVMAGVPLVPAYLVAAVLSNGALAMGVQRLARGVGLSAGAALFAGALAAIAPPDLLETGGALGGMWPYRLANGLLYAGALGALLRPRPARVAAWLAAVLLLHTFSGLVAFLCAGVAVAVHLLRRRPGAAARLAAGIAGALAITAAFWVPLLDPALRTFQEPWAAGVSDMLLMVAMPVKRAAWQAAGRMLPIGGAGGALWAALAWLGVCLAVVRRRELPDGRLLAGLALAGGGLALLASACQITGVDLMGPNPWRHLSHFRAALAVVAAGGLSTVAGARLRWAAPVLAVGGAAFVLPQLPHRLDEGRDAALDAVDAAWLDLASLPPAERPVRVLQVDGYSNPLAPPPLQTLHLGGPQAAGHGFDLLGSWYGISPTPTVAHTGSGGGLLLGAVRAQLPDPAAWLAQGLPRFAVGGVVSVDAPLTEALDRHPAFQAVGPARGPVRAYVLRDFVDPGPMRVAGALTGASLLDDQPARVAVDLEAAGPLRVQVLRSFHPWWQATLDEQPVVLQADPDTGLVLAELPHGGRLELRWIDEGRRWWPMSGLGLLVLGALLLWERRRAPRSAQPAST
ncbi:MAG: hypothetical protein H6742_04800 [Alphaproteobacteria bacterium]|nr:hypothetical protein [Alphaproteobacteria bacterium]